MNGKTYTNNLNFYFFLLRTRLNSRFKKHHESQKRDDGRKGKALYFSTFNSAFFCFLNKASCIFILYWAYKLYSWPWMDLMMRTRKPRFIRFVFTENNFCVPYTFTAKKNWYSDLLVGSAIILPVNTSLIDKCINSIWIEENTEPRHLWRRLWIFTYSDLYW